MELHAPPVSYDRIVMAAHANKPAKRHKSTQTFEYTLRGVDLVCELDWQEASGDGWHEPREPADAQLCQAIHNGGDIYELLGDDDRAEIEIAFLEQEPEDD